MFTKNHFGLLYNKELGLSLCGVDVVALFVFKSWESHCSLGEFQSICGGLCGPNCG